jgi:hypothetical protein
MENINPYNEIEFRKTFTNTEIYKKLEQNFNSQNLVWDKFVITSKIFKSKPKISAQTPREANPTIFSASVFYYLLPLLEIDYDLVYDLGCGGNMFKSYIPQLKGIGAEWSSYQNVKDPSWPNISSRQDFDNLPEWIKHECLHVHKINIDSIFYGDISDSFNDNFVLAHQEYFQSIFSICALHFYPLHLLKKIIVDFASIIKVGGRGFLSLNLQQMIERESEQFLLETFLTKHPSTSQYEQYVRKELSSINLKFLIVDIDLTCIDEYFDGNIRLVIER